MNRGFFAPLAISLAIVGATFVGGTAAQAETTTPAPDPTIPTEPAEPAEPAIPPVDPAPPATETPVVPPAETAPAPTAPTTPSTPRTPERRPTATPTVAPVEVPVTEVVAPVEIAPTPTPTPSPTHTVDPADKRVPASADITQNPLASVALVTSGAGVVGLAGYFLVRNRSVLFQRMRHLIRMSRSRVR